MSYLKYSGLAADMVRASLKEPFKSKAKLREAVYFRSAPWKDGQQQQQGVDQQSVALMTVMHRFDPGVELTVTCMCSHHGLEPP